MSCFRAIGRSANVVALIAATATALAAPSAAITGATGADRFGGCLSAQKSGQILLMIDESGSLQETDPQDRRVDAANYLVQQLSQFGIDSGVTIDVAVSGFSDDYDLVLDWTKLDAANLPAVESSIDTFRDLDTGQDTDYRAALDGARATLADAPKPAEGRSCLALAWFTDGKLDFNQRDDSKPYAPEHNLASPEGVEATIKAAQESICRDRGLADQLRSSDIVTFAIGLAPRPEQTADLDLLKAIATGVPSGAVSACGAVTDPVPGDFYLASNIDDLLFAFDKFSTPGQSPTEINTGACALVICEEAKHRFVLDRSVRSVNVLAAADRPALVPHIVAPDGTSTALEAGPAATSLDGVTIDYRPQGEKSVSFRMSGSDSPQWQGVWALVFVDPAGDAPAQTRSSIHIAGDLYPAWPQGGASPLRSNDTDVPMTFAVVNSRAEKIDPTTLLGQASLSAVLVDVDGVEHPVATDLPKDQMAVPHVMDLTGVPPGAATLQLVLNVTTADAVEPDGAVVPGTELAPQRVDLPVTVEPPVGFPTLAERIDFGTLEGAGTFPAILSVTGPGCAWLPGEGAATLAAVPDNVGDVTVDSAANSAQNCITASVGQQESLPIEMTIPAAGNGVINGTITVMVAPTDHSADPIAVDVTFTASLQKPLNPPITLITLVVALILGPGLPLLLFYLAKWLGARIPSKALRAQDIPVRVSGDAVLRDQGPFGVRDGELVNLVQGLDKPARRVEIGAATLRTRIGLSPFGAGFVVASVPGRAGAGGQHAAMHGKTPDAKLPLAVHNTWFVLHDPVGPPDVATVVLLVGGDAGNTVIDRLTSEIAAALPRVLTELRARAKQSDHAPPPPAQSSAPLDGNPFGLSGTQAGGGSMGPSEVNPFGASPTPGPSGSSTSSGPPSGGNPFPSGSPAAGSGNPFGARGAQPSAPTDPTNPFR